MNEEIICGIYKITSPTGKIYIGQSPNINFRLYKYRALDCKGQHKIYASLRKHGYEKHNTEIIERCERASLNEREIYWIRFYKSFNTKHGMNLTMGGGGNLGMIYSDATRKKMSESAKNKPPMSEAHKLKISQTLKGRHSPTKGMKQTPEHISKRLSKVIGRKATEETKRLQSIGAKGNKKWLGKKHSLETRIKMSKAQINRRQKEKYE